MCCKGVAKFVLYIVNLIFVLIGAFLAVLGGLGLWNFDAFLSIIRIVPQVADIIKLLEDVGGITLIRNSSIALLAIGCFLFVVGFLGCCGAKGEHKVLLIAFIAVLGVLLAAEIGIIIYTIVDRAGIQAVIERELEKTIHTEYRGKGLHFIDNGGTPSIQIADQPGAAAWDSLHLSMKCCGSKNGTNWAQAENWDNNYPETWDGSGFVNIQNASVPMSCCDFTGSFSWPPTFTNGEDGMAFKNVESCMRTADSGSTFNDGCVGAIFDAALRYTNITFAVLGCILGLQILEIIMACTIIQDSKSVT